MACILTHLHKHAKMNVKTNQTNLTGCMGY